MRDQTLSLLRSLLCVALLTAAATACKETAGSGTTAARVDTSRPPITRLQFNQLAMQLNLPVYWVGDHDDDERIDVNEIVALAFYGQTPTWVEGDFFTPSFTPSFRAALDSIHDALTAPPPTDERLALVHQEFASAAPTLLHTDLREGPEAHREFVRHMLRVGEHIDSLFARQVGMTALANQVPDEPESQSLFRRNWGAHCEGAATAEEPQCSAIPGSPKQPVDAYPLALQENENFCETLAQYGNATELSTPFAVVRERDGELVAVPYTEHYQPEMAAIATELEAAANAIEQDPREAALVTYLRAAAASFRSNEWEPADDAWSRMNARNSQWYVRVAPDEVYWDPCALKAGFHLTLARIDRGSLEWQDRLAPLRADMEASLAALVPGEYDARDVAFHLPDFIEIVANFGDDRGPFGATIGQSLPNWGIVAEEGRSRTVAMTNLYTDPDSLSRGRATAESLFTAETMGHYASNREAGLMSTILHEATHNLGPAQEYRVNGQDDTQLFGGGLASMLEELKAQSGALFFVELLGERGILDEEERRQTYLDSIAWALGHISRGMYTPSGNRKAYSQLAAIQVGFLMERGALRFEEDAQAANEQDRGAFSIDFEAFPDACRELMRQVMHIKATGDRAAAEALAARYVDGDVIPMSLIRERSLRQPRASFVYALDL